MNILIAGGTGFIGQALVEHFIPNHAVTVLGRDIDKIEQLFNGKVTALNWQQFNAKIAEVLRDTDLVINLTGADIGEKKWTPARKKEILDSRIIPTQQIATACADLGKDAPWLFNASAVGVYGLQKKLSRTENLPPAYDESTTIDFNTAPDFLSEIARKWEQATNIAKAHQVRVVNMRFAVVLGPGGGVLKKLKIPFMFFIGGPVGSGRQPFPWIALDDLIKAIDFLIIHTDITGPVNFVSPQGITQKMLADGIGTVLHRPSFLPTPAFLVKALFGQMGEELLLNGKHVKPKVLLDQGFEFDFPEVNKALKRSLV